jgi:hypothetical protein
MSFTEPRNDRNSTQLLYRSAGGKGIVPLQPDRDSKKANKNGAISRRDRRFIDYVLSKGGGSECPKNALEPRQAAVATNKKQDACWSY